MRRVTPQPVEEYLASLRNVSDKAYLQRLTQSENTGLLTSEQLANVRKRRLPNVSPQYNQVCRIHTSWTSIPKEIRKKIFSGCILLDISKCHLLAFNVLEARLGFEPTRWEQILAESIELGYSESEAKLMTNTMINGGGRKALREKKIKVTRLPATLKHLRALRRWCLSNELVITTYFDEVIELHPRDIHVHPNLKKAREKQKMNQWQTNPGVYEVNGEDVWLQYRSEIPSNSWVSMLNSFETWLKIKLFHELPNCQIVMDVYDAVIIYSPNIRKRRTHLIEREIDKRTQSVCEELGIDSDWVGYTMKQI